MFQNGSVWTGLISGGLSQIQDTNALAKGQMKTKEYAVQTVENVTGAVGVMAGVEYGAMLGSTVLPGFGTAVGAVLGGLVGSSVGRSVGHRAGDALVNNRMVQGTLQPLQPQQNQ
ncbi:hypothetical protein C8Z91_10740 [Paenibacillus elgii]|uniref:Glycine zipper domain-containing protein n=1 Tax=Paenibacillus elgii TaxID=189691 RepID=A0A2T6G4U0_9BACL|nr:hypothetical protein [Paenibacillus elgii]PUA39171.1 hypothetical protein C8Z91_10740 [Paenibacillus elgii]